MIRSAALVQSRRQLVAAGSNRYLDRSVSLTIKQVANQWRQEQHPNTRGQYAILRTTEQDEVE